MKALLFVLGGVAIAWSGVCAARAEGAVYNPYPSVVAGEADYTNGASYYGAQYFGDGTYTTVAVQVAGMPESVALSRVLVRLVIYVPEGEGVAEPTADSITASINLFSTLPDFGAAPMSGNLYGNQLPITSLTLVPNAFCVDGLPEYDALINIPAGAVLPEGAGYVGVSFRGDDYVIWVAGSLVDPEPADMLAGITTIDMLAPIYLSLQVDADPEYGIAADPGIPAINPTFASIREPAILGDANADGVVDDADASILATYWHKQQGANWLDGDFNGDGRVDDRDASIMAAHWGESTPITPTPPIVPEPSTLVLMALGGLGLLCRVRRAG